MITKITGEQPFQVLTNNFSISPSNEGYTLQISADGKQYSNLFSVGAGVTRLVTGVAANSYYRLLGNQSAVSVNWMKTCVTEGGAVQNELFPQDSLPENAETGAVVALSNGGVYQYDGSDWVAVGGSDMSDYWTSAETKTYVDSADTIIYTSAATYADDAIAEALADYTPTSGFSTINGSAITDGSAIVIQGGGADIAPLSAAVETLSAATVGKADKANVTARTNTDLNPYFPGWNNQGVITGETRYFTSPLYINGTSEGPFLTKLDVLPQRIYAPNSAGTAGDILVSTGEGAPVWSSFTAGDSNTLKSVSEFNPNAENGDVQSKYVELSGMPADVSFVTGDTYGANQNQYGGTLTIPAGFASGTTDQDPIYLMSIMAGNPDFPRIYLVYAYENTWHPGGVMLDFYPDGEQSPELELSLYPEGGEYGQYIFGYTGDLVANYVEDETYQGKMIVELYAASALQYIGFDATEASTEYGLYIKTDDGWKEVSAPEDVVTSSYISNIWKGTQAEYDAVTESGATADPNTFYIIVSN